MGKESVAPGANSTTSASKSTKATAESPTATRRNGGIAVDSNRRSAQSTADSSLALAAYAELLRMVTRVLGNRSSAATATGGDPRVVAAAGGWAGVRAMDLRALVR